MRKNKNLLLLLFLGLTLGVSAQNSDYRNTYSANAALNGWQIIALTDNFIDADSVIGGYAKASGTFGLSYDYAFAKWFSLGLQGTWNKGRVGADNLTIHVKDKTYTGMAELELRRLHVGARPLFHYFNSNRFDWYSGFKVGITYIKTSVNVGTDDLSDREVLDALLGNNWFLNRSYRGVRPTFQFIPVGMRAYITEHIGVGFETAIGPTYYLSGQLTYRF